MSVQGQELIEGRAFLDACEARWLVTLAEFDTSGTYEVDGHVSIVAWLVDRCGMGRSTAKEKVRVARELRRRPAVAEAFLDGTLTYSKARILTRLDGLDDGRDAAFIVEYAPESADMLERLVRWWNLRNGDQDGPAPDPYDTPRIEHQPGFGGANGRIIIEGANEDLARFMNLIDAYGSFLFFNSQKAPNEPPLNEAFKDQPLNEAFKDQPVDEAPKEPPVLCADNTDGPAETIAAATGEPEARWAWDEPERESGSEPVDEAPMEPLMSLAQRRFEWLYDLIEEVALVRADQLDPDRAAVAVTVPYENLFGPATAAKYGIIEGGPVLTGPAVRRLCCDAGISRMVVKGASEILDVGRQTRTWSRAQRRAIRARHGHQCAVRGCDRRITQIHHLTYWRNGGETCIENGVPLCSRHHHMVHDLDWTITWNHHTGVTTFTGPAGQTLACEVDPFLVRSPAFAAA